MNDLVYAVLLAGGSGTRMGAGINKVLLPVDGIPCIARSAMALSPFADRMTVVCRAGEEEQIAQALAGIPFRNPPLFVPGGDTRQRSVLQGLRALSPFCPENAAVLIHDGARCLVDREVIRAVLDSVQARGSGAAAVPVTDTLRSADPDGLALATVPREGVQAMQTPQGALFSSLLRAYEICEKEGVSATDDAFVLAHAGFPVYLTPGSRFNLKLTTKEDLAMAEAILQTRASERNPEIPPLRVGQGYDVHQLCEGRKLILCGVEVPWEKGLLGHSDADVALHALMDALLGAAGLGDIGRHFPDTNEQYRGIDSMLLLREVMKRLKEAGFRPINADVTIVAQRPKLAPFIPRMAENLADALELPLSCINVKATTTEKLGFEGRMEGISAQAVCLIQSK